MYDLLPVIRQSEVLVSQNNLPTQFKFSSFHLKTIEKLRLKPFLFSDWAMHVIRIRIKNGQILATCRFVYI